ncbi:MAG: FliM/FliN family flagellar motor switch protein [Candidatus Poseidoniia archaeon]|mgnify:FL=1|jgi:flagellar motor switch protein FliN/FliY|nr:FliM/FliN family flagellar motor switch protein [Candidatus Poseidoniia archaeon]|tara:strand:+ start:2736 stop:3065 length:330 start_codon:yes stop_codon:yes gene_type:complete
MSETTEGQDGEEEVDSQSSEGHSIIDHSVVLSIPIVLNVEVGKTKLKLSELMAVAQGSVLELDRTEGDLMDIKVNESVIAKGEVVTLSGNKLGIRVLEIVSPLERIRSA